MHLEWQKQRNVLNHDWLKNEFTRHLRAFIARLETPTQDLSRLSEFASQDWPRWEVNRQSLAALLDSAESELSPRQLLLDETPRCQWPADTRIGLSRVVHLLWLARTSVRQQIEDARAALVDADRKYRELAPLLASVDSIDPERLRQASASFLALERDVEHLADRLSQLPHKVQFV